MTFKIPPDDKLRDVYVTTTSPESVTHDTITSTTTGKGQIPLRYPGRRPGSRPAASWNLAYHALSNLGPRKDLPRTQTGPKQVCDQPRTCLRPE